LKRFAAPLCVLSFGIAPLLKQSSVEMGKSEAVTSGRFQLLEMKKPPVGGFFW
jgi:hypothetical protein